MYTCGLRVQYVMLAFYWMNFNIWVSGTPVANVTETSECDERHLKQSYPTPGRRKLPYPEVPISIPGLDGANGNPHQQRLRPLAFSTSVYAFEVKEDIPPGTVVGTVEVLDGGGGWPPVYSVLEDDGNGLFLLSALSGEFSLNRALDYELERYYVLTAGVQRADSQSAEARVYISVVDVNDNPPVFRPDTYSASLLEDTPVDTCFLALNASDADSGVNAELDWAVIAGDEDARFAVTPSGVICLRCELDREKIPMYALTVQVNDRAMPADSRLTNTAHVSIHVEDVNDNAPSFESAMKVEIPEDTPPHRVVIVAHAVDLDLGSNGLVEYQLENWFGSALSVDSWTGWVYLEEPLDREHSDIFSVLLTARDRGSPRLSTSANFTIIVGDVNDNDPTFTRSSYSTTVREDVPRGTSLLQVQAYDPDTGLNGQVRYLLSRGPFLVDPVSGVVSLKDRLDRERSPTYSVTVIAVDQGDARRTGSALFRVTVTDVNDCVPLLSPPSVTLHVLENSEDLPQIIYQVSTIDDDLGVNSQLTLSIEAGDEEELFSLSPNGTLWALRSLDRETKAQHTLHVIAVDSGLPPLTGTGTVHIMVGDLNDNRPTFSQEMLQVTVDEDASVGTVVAMIQASDLDEGDNGIVRYSLEGNSGPFAINESGVMFTTGVLDRETVVSYRVTVIASDMHPILPLSSTATVSVQVEDMNDNRPGFLHSPYVAYVPTKIAPGSILCAVSALDADVGVNAQLTFSLFGRHANLFTINPVTGSVSASEAFEGTDDIIVGVLVKDGGEDAKSDTTTVTIRFRNASEFPRVTVGAHKQWLSEDEPLGTLVATVTAESPRPGPVSYYLASGNFEEIFQLDPEGGELTISRPLDYEANAEFLLGIEARDAGSPPFSSYSEIRINVRDVNDNSPVFTQSVYRCEVTENVPARQLCEVLAIDADSENYRKVEYNILRGNVAQAFEIDADTGIVRTLKSLDREKISSYNLTIQATDKENMLNTGTAMLHVTVLDTNDHAPRFLQIFFAEVPEDTPVGFTVIQVTSTDEDIGENADTTYTIIDNPSQSGRLPFTIDKTSGSVVLMRSLDRETQGRYVIKVNANDSAWSISTDVTIDITDVNDNGPIFLRSPYSVTITETEVREVFVLQVHAMDADLGPNGQVLYYIEPPSEIFTVNASTGDIFTKQPVLLHSSESHSLHFTIVASDSGDVPFRSDTTVTVIFLPYNHFPPAFLPLRPLLSVPYNLEVGTAVIQVSAVDQDIEFRATAVEYTASGGNASLFFDVEINSGQVWLKRSLSQMLNAVLTLLVTAKDKAVEPLSSQTVVSFAVTLENQFAPYFTHPLVIFSVPEDLPLGSVIGWIRATDKDDGINGLLHYSFEGENEDSLFTVGPDTGLITLIGKLDAEKEGVHHFQLSAIDAGWVPKTGQLNVTVSVQDVNDNPPVFLAPEYTASIPENSPVGATVFQVQATDRDSGDNAEITYTLVTGDVDLFAVEPRSGAIISRESFDFELQQLFQVTVKASNTGSLGRFSIAHVYIRVTGVNEYVPIFRKSQYNFTVSESSPVGTRVGKVSATDNDQGLDGEVSYLLIGRSKVAGFSVDERSGEIFIRDNLRQLGYGQKVLRLLAKNWGSINGTDVDETFIQVNVLDANDPPQFRSGLYTAQVSEGVAVGTVVTRVSAEDRDSVLEWSRFSYHIEMGNIDGSFTLHPFNGTISVNVPLDRERWPLYNLTITAIDHGSPPATGSTQVNILVGDVNDNAPVLSSTEAYVVENQPLGTVVAVLNASDADLPPNQGPFMYWLANPSSASDFSLTFDGVLTTTRPVDREHNPAYLLIVVVQDSGTPALSNSATVHIKVLDENDNPSAPRSVYIEVKYYGTSFPGGPIGNVHPEDPDELDIFSCIIKNGPGNIFSFRFDNCELWSSRYQGEATFNVTVEANDQLHPSVNNSVYVNYKGFTNATLDNCVLFYVTKSSFEDFLSFKYLKFVKALDSLFNLQASKTHVFAVKVLEDSILLLAAVKSYNGQYLSGEVASDISATQKNVLEAQSSVRITQITSDPCITSPCQNGGTCIKNVHISQDIGVLESPRVIFVSPKRVEVFTCSCVSGFTGTRCELDVDECDESPCENGGMCINHPRGFSCQCTRGFTGWDCSTDVDECQSAPCQNGGSCLNMPGKFRCNCALKYKGEFCEQFVDHCGSSPCLSGTCTSTLAGYTCHCPFGVSGGDCEEHIFGFGELSYVEFPPLDSRNNIISLELATVRPDSLLLYNHGGLSSSEFLALELVGGEVQLSYDLGQGTVRLRVEKKVADGLFHKVVARRTGKVASLQVDSCSDDEPIGFCYSQTEAAGSERSLDIGYSHMTFGGIKSIDAILLRPTQVRTQDFIGCVRNVKVNSIPLDLSGALASYNVLDRCPRAAASPGCSTPCMNGGVCRDHWSHYSCHCGDQFTGASCATEVSQEHALRLNGQTYVEFRVKESYRRERMLKGGRKQDWTPLRPEIEIKLKTAMTDGAVLFYGGRDGHAALRITDGRLLHISGDGTSGQMTEMAAEAAVSDSRWHIVRLLGGGPAYVILLDGNPVMNSSAAGVLDVTWMHLGGSPVSGNQQPEGFSGCVEYFRYDGHTLPFSGFSEVVETSPSSELSYTGCGSVDVCGIPTCMEEKEDASFVSCVPENCPGGAACGDICVCLRNSTGAVCELCRPSSGSRNLCPEPHTGPPLWVIGVVLPSAFVLIGLALLLVLKLKDSKTQSVKLDKTCSLAKRGKRGRDNEAFHGDEGDDPKAGQPDIIRENRRVCLVQGPPVHGCGEAVPPRLEEGPQNELEYYDIDSTCSVFCSDAATSSEECTNLSGGLSGDEQRTPSLPACPRDSAAGEAHTFEPRSEGQDQAVVPTIGRGCQGPSHFECGARVGLSSSFVMRTLAPDPMGPPWGLSVEELRRLDVPLHQRQDVCWRETSNGSSERIPSPRCDVPPSEIHGRAGSFPSRGIQQWESLLNLGLNFDTYSQVFEDIAALPSDPQEDHDALSEEEDII